MSEQIVMVSFEELVPSSHVYRKFANIWDFAGIQKHLKDIENDNNYKGYGMNSIFFAMQNKTKKMAQLVVL